MDAEPADQNWAEVWYEEVFDNRPNLWYFGEDNWFEVEVPVVKYSIYHNGKIEKEDNKNAKSGKYIYIDMKGKKHDLGTYDFLNIKNNYFTNKKYGLTKYINLIDLKKIKNYTDNDIKYKLAIDSPRHYINEHTLASIFGAMLKCGFEDFVCNGFSHANGSSTPSISHKNGYHGDFKYLRKDKAIKLGKGTSLNILNEPKKLDFTRQNMFNDALIMFGWQNLLGWSYIIKKKKYFLNHISKESTNHEHHLHVEKYNHKHIQLK